MALELELYYTPSEVMLDYEVNLGILSWKLLAGAINTGLAQPYTKQRLPRVR